MLLLILLAVLGQTVDYNGNNTKDYSYSKKTSVAGQHDTASEVPKPVEYLPSFESEMLSAALGQNYTEASNGRYTQNYLLSSEKYTMDYSHTQDVSPAYAQKLDKKMQSGKKFALEAQRNAEQKEAEEKDAYEQKMAAEKTLQLVEERYNEVHSEKMLAEEAYKNAVIRYEEVAQEAENAREVFVNAKKEVDRAELEVFETDHEVEMQEAKEAIIKSKLEREEHWRAELEYKEKKFNAKKESLEAQQAEEDAQEAAVFAEKQNQEAQSARDKVQVAGNHRDIQKAEAMEAHNEAGIALGWQEVAEAYHENVIASKETSEELWDEVLENDQYYRETHDKEDPFSSILPQCLTDCLMEGVDMNDPVYLCPWWQLEVPQNITESCMNDCSPAHMLYIEHHVQELCYGGSNKNPMECTMDCPIERVNAHSAESFCPWFSKEKVNECFHDCSNKILDLLQAHAEHTCHDYEMEADKYINYISEPFVGADGESFIICEGGYYLSSEGICTVCPAGEFSITGDNECLACSIGLTSIPGAASHPEDCFVRPSREIVGLTAPTPQAMIIEGETELPSGSGH